MPRRPQLPDDYYTEEELARLSSSGAVVEDSDDNEMETGDNELSDS